MDFLIADTFTDSLARLTGDEQKAVKTTAFDLQINPDMPGMSQHRIERARDKNFWSVRVSRDIRLIIHRGDSSLLLCYVDHHDKAYEWAERRKLERHPRTGAAQLVEFRERIEDVVIPRYVEQPASPAPSSAPASVKKQPVFPTISDDELLGYGVPTEWLDAVREADEDTLLDVADHLPREAAEALLELATGGKPKPTTPPAPDTDPFAHPDAQRRFRVVTDVDALRQALDYPWDKWTVFLHPAQRQLIEREYTGPARVSGSAGTGKTIVALHRAVHLARRHPDSRTLLCTFSPTLANALHDRLRRLVSSEPRLAERIEVAALGSVGHRLYSQQFGAPKRLAHEDLCSVVKACLEKHPSSRFSASFIQSEWREIVDAWQLKTWESYRDVRRLGRKTRLAEKVRAEAWEILADINRAIDAKTWVSESAMFTRLGEHFRQATRLPYEHVVVDESQDVTAAQLGFLAALGRQGPETLFFAGDLGQRIFQTPFSWKSVGVDIRGRSKTLSVNYRTSHQIRLHADLLLGPSLSDVDGETEVRKGTISVFNGPPPEIIALPDQDKEIAFVGKWIKARRAEGLAPHEIGVIVRSDAELSRARRALESAGEPLIVLDENMKLASGQVCVCTMHLAKGLEFRAVAVMACDDEVVPLQSRVEEITDEADLEEVYATERHLLYVAVTRARDQLLVTSARHASEFLDDLRDLPG